MKLQIRHAIAMYGADTILDDANFEIRNNEKIALVGRNGCGKTTFLKLITGELETANLDSDEDAVFMIAGGTTIGMLKQISFEDGSISVENEIKKVFAPVYECGNALRETENALSKTTDPKEHERLLSRLDSLQRRFDALEGHTCEREMLIMFQKFGFAIEDLKRPIGEFSGGQQTKIAFMKLLLSKPDILLLDEPTNHLDLPTIEWLEDYLRNYKHAVVIVSHDRAFLDGIVSVTYEIEYGIMKRYSGNYSAFVKQKEENFLKQEKDFEAQQKEIKRLQDWIEKWKNTPTKITSVRSKRKVIEHMIKVEKPRKFDVKAFRANFTPRIESYSEVLKVKDLKLGYDRQLCSTSFTLRRGERLAVVGRNGIGKSTLLKTLVGLIPSLGGSFEYGKNVEWGYFDQQQALINDQDPEQSVLDNFWDTYPRLTREEARSALGAFVFSGEEVEKKLGGLSGGERVRLALCKMFFTKPNLIILDEPTNHMDMIGKEALEDMLVSYEGTVIFVSHDRYFISKTATNVLEFEGEETRFYNMPYKEYREEKRRLEARGDETETAPVQNAPARNDNLISINPGKLESKLLKKIERLEAEMAGIEDEISVLKKKLEDPETAADYQKLMDVQNNIDEKEAAAEDILEKIMEAEEELETVRNQM